MKICVTVPVSARIVAHVCQGSIEVHPPLIRSLGTAVREFRFDLKAKYAKVWGYGGDSEILVHFDENTLKHDDTKDPTSVWFDLPKHWKIQYAYVSRYTLHCFIAKDIENDRTWAYRPLWVSKTVDDRKGVKIT